MQNDGTPKWHIVLFIIVLLAGVISLFIFQLNIAENATKRELALINILQFILSLGFATLLSRIITEQQFISSQRKFAVGAFRRIKEIERLISRTQKYVSESSSLAREEMHQMQPVISEALAGAKDIVRSSIADWADVIGDEIEVEREIQRLKKWRSEQDELTSRSDADQDDAKLEDISKRIGELMAELPPELRASVTVDEDDGYEVDKAVERLADIWREERALIFDAFWEPAAGLMESLDDLSVGDNVEIARGYAGKRINGLFAYNSNNNTIGVVTNLCNCRYDVFTEATEEFFERNLFPRLSGGVPLSGTVEAIESVSPTTERQYFKIRVERMPAHACVYEEEEDNDLLVTQDN